MPNTVDLTRLQIDASKQFAMVQSGQMSITDYIAALEAAQGVKAEWVNPDNYVVNFARGIRDPFGVDLNVPEIEQIVKALIPSPLQSAGKTITLRGPMLGFISGLLAR